MAALVCDICGGKLSMGTGGIAVCESCGMEHTQARMQEKVQEIKGVVRVDNSHMVQNYLTMAENAYDADNKKEAESYCNKIIEIEPSSYKAWLLKGKAAGWSSTIKDNRFNEAANCFAKSIEFAPKDEKESITLLCTEEMKRLSVSLIRLRGERFAAFPDDDEMEGFSKDIETILEAEVRLFSKSGAMSSGLLEALATSINAAVVNAWNKIESDFINENLPDKEDLVEFIARIGYCIELVERAIDLSDEDHDEDIARYENLIFFHNEVINAKIESNGAIIDLNERAKQERTAEIAELNKKISQIKNKARQVYWDAHEEEKIAIESEKELLKAQIALLDSEINAISNHPDKPSLEEQIRKLNVERNNLGLFKAKEKKVIEDQIDAIKVQIRRIEEQVRDAIEEIEVRKAPLVERFNEIEEELTKDR